MKGILKIVNGDWYVGHRYITRSNPERNKGRDTNLHYEEIPVHPFSLVESGLEPKENLHVDFEYVNIKGQMRARILI